MYFLQKSLCSSAHLTPRRISITCVGPFNLWSIWISKQ
jgi:hypothetical protein